MREYFLKSMSVVLVYEGGFSNHPADPGGRTLQGIIQRVYDGFRDRKGLPRRQLTQSLLRDPEWPVERNEIYRAQYWAAVRGDELPAGVDMVLFDSAVNSGPYQAIKWLQRALQITADGHLGEGTLAAVKAHPDHDALVAEILSRRLGMLRQLSTWDTFGAGWTKRLASVRKIGQAWATGSVGPRPVEVHADGGAAKAYASDVAQPAVDAQTAGTTAVGGAGVAGLVNGAKDQLGALVGTSDLINQLYLALTVLAVIIAVSGVIYSFWSSWKSKRARNAVDGLLMADVPEGQPA